MRVAIRPFNAKSTALDFNTSCLQMYLCVLQDPRARDINLSTNPETYASVYIYIYIYIYICTINIYIYICDSVCIPYNYIYMYIICICMYIYILCVFICTHAWTSLIVIAHSPWQRSIHHIPASTEPGTACKTGSGTSSIQLQLHIAIYIMLVDISGY